MACSLHKWHEFAEEEVIRFDFALMFWYN